MKSDIQEDEHNKSIKEISYIKTINKLVFITIAFNQGVGHISQLAVQYFFKDELKVEPTRLAQINSIMHIPWAIKPILGLITDLLPIMGYRRKIYILICGVINILCWLYMSFYSKSEIDSCLVITLINLTLAFCSVIGEAIVVELSQLETEDKDSKAKDLVSLFFMSRTFGELLSSYLKGLFVDIMHLRTIFIVSSFIPVLLLIAGFSLKEKRININETNSDSNSLPLEENSKLIDKENNFSKKVGNKKTSFNEFTEFICQKHILIPLIFIITFKAVPSYWDPFFFFITNELKINATSLGKIYFCSTIGILIAIFIYKAYLKNCNFKFMIILGTIISFLISLACFFIVLRINIELGISDFWLLLFTNSFLSMVGEFILLPILSLACVLCPKNLEGTVYSVFMSSLNLGGILSNLNGGILTSIMHISSKNYDNLHWLILTAKISSLLPLPILCCIDDKYFHPEKKEQIPSEDEEKTNKISLQGKVEEKLTNDNNEKIEI